MENIFLEDETIGQDLLSLISRRPLAQETCSATSQQNLKNSLTMLKLSEREQSINLVIASSNYHLPDIAVILETLPDEVARWVRVVLLAGSERMDRLTATTRDSSYVKQCFFRLFTSILTKELSDSSREQDPSGSGSLT